MASHIHLRLIFGILVCVACLAAACEEFATTEEPAKTTPDLPPAQVDLPPVPADLGVPKTPDKHPDGSLTVAGLLRNRPTYLSKPVKVKGYITSIYDCPHWEKNQPKKPKRRRRVVKKKTEEEEAKPKMCERPHFYLVGQPDAPLDDKSLLVVKISPFIQEKIDEEEIKAGAEYTLAGTFIEIAEGFTAADKGLLRLDSIDGFEPEAEDDGTTTQN